MLLTESYREQQQILHRTNPKYGIATVHWVKVIDQMAASCRAREILDYGCGKRELEKALGEHYRIINYDPAFEEFSAPPAPGEFVVCGDVLEHIEPDCLDAVLDDLRRVTAKHGLFIIATRPAKKFLPDGRNAHLIVQPLEWWIPRLTQRFYLKSFQNMSNDAFLILVRKK